MAIATYEVTVNGFPPSVYSAVSPGKARADAWRSFTHCYDCSFKDFLRISRVRKCPPPLDDGYSYVRTNYGVAPKIGGRVRLVNEGSSSGLEGEIVYPGKCTAHIHVVIDGREHAVAVHPYNVEMITSEAV